MPATLKLSGGNSKIFLKALLDTSLPSLPGGILDLSEVNFVTPVAGVRSINPVFVLRLPRLRPSFHFPTLQ
jgi:hypothetical protein